jgi:lipoprotein NlpD
VSGTSEPAILLLALGLSLLLAACSSEPPKRTVAHARTSVASSSASRADGNSYTVIRGDTLYSIAFRNQLDYHDLANWNDIGRDYAIRVGQVLRLTPPGPTALPADRGDGVAAMPAAPPATPSAPHTVSPIVAAAAGPALPASGAVKASQSVSSPAVPATTGRRGDGSWQWPTRGRVVRQFGEDPSAKGLDITGDRGQLVIASRSGKVVYSGTALKGYGELIIVKHDEQYLSAYGYNRKRLVEEGDSVVAGQPIAELGDGPEQRPLLHFEIRDKGRPVDPALLLPAR